MKNLDYNKPPVNLKELKGENWLNISATLTRDYKAILAKSAPQIFQIFGAAKTFSSLWISGFKRHSTSMGLVVVADFNQMLNVAAELEFFEPRLKIKTFPNLDVSPYDDALADPKLIANRLQSLQKIIACDCDLVIAPIQSLLDKTLPQKNLSQASYSFKVGDRMSRAEWQKKLLSLGYCSVDQVETAGEFSFKGDKLDLFSANYRQPLRILFFDDEIETIKYFGIDSQLSSNDLKVAEIFSVSEVLLIPENITKALAALKDYIPDLEAGDYHKIVRQVSSGGFFGGIRKLLPLFYDELSSLVEYLPPATNVFLVAPDQIKTAYDLAREEINREYIISKEQGALTVDAVKLFNSWQDLRDTWRKTTLIELIAGSSPPNQNSFNLTSSDNEFLFSQISPATKDHHGRITDLFRQIELWHNQEVVVSFVASNTSNAQRIKNYLAERNLTADVVTKPSSELKKRIFWQQTWQAGILILLGDLKTGYRIYDRLGHLKQLVLSDLELFGRPSSRRLIKKRLSQKFTNLDSLNIGDYVTHLDYGIGRYEGLTHFPHQDNITDCLVISYLGQDKVYVPVDRLNLVQKYTSADNHPPKLHKLSTASWKKQKAKVAGAVVEVAKELVALYAARKAYRGVSFRGMETDLIDFCRGFAYEETEDQKEAIETTLADLDSDKPMDRLVCGDVGFGKTEIALRAIFKVAAHGCQAALVVPTTILAEQHFLTFASRFADFPYEVGHLSRFQSEADAKKTLQKLATGDLSIIIGTHRLFSKDVVFKNLGLLVIDEEHHFGVKQKEFLRIKRTQVDTLSLSATPIPRSLHMSLSGIRDISLINTPPIDRQKVKTRVLKFEPILIKEVITRELRRGGQVYFIHNQVRTINQIADFLQTLLPQAVIKIAHGQLHKKDLEVAMAQFIAGKISVLVSSAIVESGLDIPAANTLIVNNADKLGLSQLYQLRGRVGRRATQAYAYFLTDPDKILSDNAKRRLQALQEHTDLGSGFKIAAYDLEIRGAGNFLGAQQSGNIAAVGMETYLSMLEEAVAALKDEKSAAISPLKTQDIKMSVRYDAFLSESYIASPRQRLAAYQEISACSNEDEVWNLASNFADRFGPLPSAAKNLLDSILVKIWGAKLCASAVDLDKHSLVLHLTDKFEPDIAKLLEFLTKNNGRLMPPHKVAFHFENQEINVKIGLLKRFYAVIT